MTLSGLERADVTPAAKAARVAAANELIAVIAGCGRRFFHHQGRVARLERDARGRVWFVSEWSGKRQYTHYPGQWRRFAHGGTMRALVEALRDFIVYGDPVPPGHFGPWASWYADGDLWGYGEEAMATVRAAARRLGVVRGEAEPRLGVVTRASAGA